MTLLHNVTFHLQSWQYPVSMMPKSKTLIDSRMVYEDKKKNKVC